MGVSKRTAIWLWMLTPFTLGAGIIAVDLQSDGHRREGHCIRGQFRAIGVDRRIAYRNRVDRPVVQGRRRVESQNGARSRRPGK